MNNQTKIVAANLRYLRQKNQWSQEYVAEKIGVSRQAVAKWENGDSLPDLLNCAALADLYTVSLNDLVRHDSDQAGLPIAPLNKHIFGAVTVGNRGQIVLPKKARETFSIKGGDTLVVLGDSNPATAGIAILTADSFFRWTGHSLETLLAKKED